MSSDSIIRVLVTGDAKGLSAATKQVQAELDKTGKSAKSASNIVGSSFAFGAGAAVAFGAESVHAADQFELADGRLRVAIKNSGDEWSVYSSQIDAAINKGAQFGHNSTDVETALATMTTGLGSTKKALDLLPLAENIAAAKNMDLNAAALLATKASEGQSRALKQLAIDAPVAAGGAVKVTAANKALTAAQQNLALVEEKVHDGRLKGPAAADALSAANMRLHTAQSNLNTAETAGKVITDLLASKYSGEASQAAETFDGKQKALEARFDNLKVKAGLLIEKGLVGIVDWYDKSGAPALEHFGGKLDDVGHDFSNVMHDIEHDVETIGKGIVTGFDATINGVIRAINDAIQAYNDIPFHKDIAKVPYIGRSASASASAGSAASGHSPAHPTGPPPKSSGHTIINNITVQGADPNTVITAAAKYARRNGVR